MMHRHCEPHPPAEVYSQSDPHVLEHVTSALRTPDVEQAEVVFSWNRLLWTFYNTVPRVKKSKMAVRKGRVEQNSPLQCESR